MTCTILQLIVVTLRTGAIPPQYIHIWAICTDAGADQLAFRNSIKTEMGGDEFCNQLIWDVSCVKHQLHLLVKDSMQHSNSFLEREGFRNTPYFSAVAQVVHCWRAHGAKLNQIFNTIIPEPWRYKAAVSLPPTAVAGRWGSIDCYLAQIPWVLLGRGCMLGCFQTCCCVVSGT